MINQIDLTDKKAMIVPYIGAGVGFLGSKENRFRNALIGYGVGYGLLYLLNASSEANIDLVESNRRHGQHFTFIDQDSEQYNELPALHLNENGISDLNPVFALPTEDVSVANYIDLPTKDGSDRTLLINPPTSFSQFPDDKQPQQPIYYGAPPGLENVDRNRHASIM